MSSSFDYESVIWGGGPPISAKNPDFLDHSLHLRYALDALSDVSDGKVVEVGCGSGRFIASVGAARPELETHGCDLSETALKEASQRPGLHCKLADAARLPYEDNSFDAVLMIDVLEHVPDVAQTLDEVRRILKPGMPFHLVFPCERHPWTLLGHLGFLRRLKRRHAGHIQQIAPKELFKALKKATFDQTDTNYSYHLLGQIYDAAIFTALGAGVDVHGARRSHVETEGDWNVVNGIRAGVSRLLYAESRLLSKVPLGMTVHVTCH